MTSPLLTIAAGGTGGHMFPAQALAEEMLRRGWRVKLSTDERGARYTGAFPAAVAIEQIKSATFARGGPLAMLGVPVRIARGILMARGQMAADRPALVAGFGGYPTIPALAAAGTLRIPRLIHEQNGVLGRVNAVFARRVDTVACGTWPTDLPTGAKGEDIGNPVRGAIRDKAGAPYAAPAPDGPLRVLVIGGSQGARILSTRIAPALAALPDAVRARLHVAHQAREEDATDVTRTYSEAGITAEVSPFFTDVPDRLAACHLVISRSGASSVADISAIGRPALLIPYAAATNDHQTANARGLVTTGAAALLPEADLTVPAATSLVQDILTDPERADTMAAAARQQGRPDATNRLADLVETLANRQK